jgi:hypothetical protein
MATRRSRAPRSTSPKTSRTSRTSDAPAAQDVAVLSTRIDFSLPVMVDAVQAAEMLRDIDSGWDELLA